MVGTNDKINKWGFWRFKLQVKVSDRLLEMSLKKARGQLRLCQRVLSTEAGVSFWLQDFLQVPLPELTYITSTNPLLIVYLSMRLEACRCIDGTEQLSMIQAVKSRISPPWCKDMQLFPSGWNQLLFLSRHIKHERVMTWAKVTTAACCWASRWTDGSVSHGSSQPEMWMFWTGMHVPFL